MLTLAEWTEDSLDLLRRCNTPAMTEHLGGPETDVQLISRHVRYLGYLQSDPQEAWPLRVLVDGELVGSVTFWMIEGGYELGWAICPEFQGRGYATAAVEALLSRARAAGQTGTFHATPAVTNLASNGVARKAGFTLAREIEIEYPPGHPMRANDWVFELH